MGGRVKKDEVTVAQLRSAGLVPRQAAEPKRGLAKERITH